MSEGGEKLANQISRILKIIGGIFAIISIALFAYWYFCFGQK